MDEFTDDRWIIDLLDGDTDVSELHDGFEATLRRELQTAWSKAPTRTPQQIARRRSTVLKVACSLAVVGIAAAAIIARGGRDDRVRDPVVSSPTTREPDVSVAPTPTTLVPDTTATTGPTDPTTTPTGPVTDDAAVAIVAAESPALSARDLRTIGDLGDPEVLVSNTGVIAVIERGGQQRVLALGLGGDLVTSSVSLDGARDSIFGLDGRLYVLRGQGTEATITSYEPRPNQDWTEFATATISGAGAACNELSVEKTPQDPDVSWVVRCPTGEMSNGDIPLGTATLDVGDDATMTVSLSGVRESWLPQIADGVGSMASAWPGPGATAIVTFAAGADGDRRIAVLDQPGTAAAVTLPTGLEPLGISGTSLIALDSNRAMVVAVDLAELIAGRDLDPNRFVPECASSMSAASGVSPQHDSLTTFGPLGIDPNLVISLPSTVSELAPAPQPAGASAVQISGGVLVSIRPTSTGQIDGSMTAAVNHDGTVRWVRCDPVTLAAYASADGTQALLAEPFASEGTIEMTVISLTNGSATADFTSSLRSAGLSDQTIGRMAVIASSPTSVVLGPAWDVVPDPAVDELVVVSLADFSIERVPLPPNSVEPSTSVSFASDGVTLTSGDAASADHVAYIDRAWATTAPQTIVEFDYGSTPQTLQGVEGGVANWRRDDLLASPDEGFHTAPAGDGVTLVRACADLTIDSATGRCASFVLALVDNDTGATLWHRDGSYGVSVIGDGSALVAPPEGGWTMIDIATGDAVPGQQWTSDVSLGTECCGGYDTVHTGRSGGIVVAVDGNTMSIYYPIDSARPTMSLTIA